MSPNLIAYLKENKWKEWFNGWELTLNSECYACIMMRDGGYIYGEDCPDVRMPIEDFFPDLFFDSEEKLIQFLEKIKLTN